MIFNQKTITFSNVCAFRQDLISISNRELHMHDLRLANWFRELLLTQTHQKHEKFNACKHLFSCAEVRNPRKKTNNMMLIQKNVKFTLTLGFALAKTWSGFPGLSSQSVILKHPISYTDKFWFDMSMNVIVSNKLYMHNLRPASSKESCHTSIVKIKFTHVFFTVTLGKCPTKYM